MSRRAVLGLAMVILGISLAVARWWNGFGDGQRMDGGLLIVLLLLAGGLVVMSTAPETVHKGVKKNGNRR